MLSLLLIDSVFSTKNISEVRRIYRAEGKGHLAQMAHFKGGVFCPGEDDDSKSLAKPTLENKNLLFPNCVLLPMQT